MNTTNQADLFTRQQVADAFGVKYRTILRWEAKGIIKPTLHITNHPRYSKEAIAEVITVKEVK